MSVHGRQSKMRSTTSTNPQYQTYYPRHPEAGHERRVPASSEHQRHPEDLYRAKRNNYEDYGRTSSSRYDDRDVRKMIIRPRFLTQQEAIDALFKTVNNTMDFCMLLHRSFTHDVQYVKPYASSKIIKALWQDKVNSAEKPRSGGASSSSKDQHRPENDRRGKGYHELASRLYQDIKDAADAAHKHFKNARGSDHLAKKLFKAEQEISTLHASAGTTPDGMASLITELEMLQVLLGRHGARDGSGGHRDEMSRDRSRDGDDRGIQRKSSYDRVRPRMASPESCERYEYRNESPEHTARGRSVSREHSPARGREDSPGPGNESSRDDSPVHVPRDVGQERGEEQCDAQGEGTQGSWDHADAEG